MQEESATILRILGVGAMLYLFIKICLWINDLAQGKIGHFFQAIPPIFPKTFSENTLWAVMIFFPVAYLGYLVIKHEPKLVVGATGVTVGLLAIFLQNIWLIPILCVVAILPFIIERICTRMVDMD